MGPLVGEGHRVGARRGRTARREGRPRRRRRPTAEQPEQGLQRDEDEGRSLGSAWWARCLRDTRGSIVRPAAAGLEVKDEDVDEPLGEGLGGQDHRRGQQVPPAVAAHVNAARDRRANSSGDDQRRRLTEEDRCRAGEAWASLRRRSDRRPARLPLRPPRPRPHSSGAGGRPNRNSAVQGRQRRPPWPGRSQ